MEFYLNVGGSEWIIIIFAALVLILGTNKLPETARALGRASAQYKKAKQQVQSQINEHTNQNVNITGPVETRREKLDLMAKSMGIDPDGKDIDDLQTLVNEKIGKKQTDDKV